MNQLTIIQTTQVFDYYIQPDNVVLHTRVFVSSSSKSSRMPGREELWLAEMQGTTVKCNDSILFCVLLNNF